MAKIGFIGLGHMGNPMAANLIKAGHHLQVFDLSQSAIEALLAKGASPAGSPAEAAKGAEVVITMLQTAEQVKASCLGPQGFFAEASPELLYIDSSSIEITATQALHEEAQKQGLTMVDAPVSGGVLGAEAGSLTMMVGGEPAAFERAKPYLEKLGKKIIHAGPAGRGQAAKICNNLILAISMIAVCEGFNLAERLGLDSKTFFDISSNASGQCWSMTSYCPAPGVLENSPASKNYQPGFMSKMMLKDLRLAQRAAAEVQALIPLGAEAAELYSLIVNQGQGELDFSVMMKLIQGKLGTK